MNSVIDNINQGLRNFAQSLKQEATAEIKNALPKSSPAPVPVRPAHGDSNVSNPERPWVVAGGAALAVGIIGILCSSGSWSYILGGAGLASIIYGQSQKRPQDNRAVPQSLTSFPEPKGYEVAEKLIAISKMVEDKWRSKVEECKGAVQNAIQAASVSPETKDSLIGLTYTTERINIDFDPIISKLDTATPAAFLSILAEFEGIVTRSIDKAVSEQTAIFNNISQKL